MASGAGAIPSYGNLIVQNHKAYQFISFILLLASGPFELITLILAVFLLFKSRIPYKKEWYLGNLNELKTAIYIFSWLGLITAGVYFGYTLTFFLQLGRSGCTSTELLVYSSGYFLHIILGGIMFLFTLINNLTSIGIHREPAHLD
jgi:hypothetical protein